ncbi:hypothetical protein B0H14DRAFT_3139571 [Mycena olivaceomarginata]|nr:hypothetical protein B0H14DRAFT_3139571 [Mycena olivaceomarginata]
MREPRAQREDAAARPGLDSGVRHQVGAATGGNLLVEDALALGRQQDKSMDVDVVHADVGMVDIDTCGSLTSEYPLCCISEEERSSSLVNSKLGRSSGIRREGTGEAGASGHSRIISGTFKDRNGTRGRYLGGASARLKSATYHFAYQHAPKSFLDQSHYTTPAARRPQRVDLWCTNLSSQSPLAKPKLRFIDQGDVVAPRYVPHRRFASFPVLQSPNLLQAQYRELQADYLRALSSRTRTRPVLASRVKYSHTIIICSPTQDSAQLRRLNSTSMFHSRIFGPVSLLNLSTLNCPARLAVYSAGFWLKGGLLYCFVYLQTWNVMSPCSCSLWTFSAKCKARDGALRLTAKNCIRTEDRSLACRMVYFSFCANADLPPQLGLVSADLNVALICAWAIHHCFHMHHVSFVYETGQHFFLPEDTLGIGFFVTLCGRPRRSFFVLEPTPRLRLGADLIRSEGVLWRTPTAFLPPMKIVYEELILELRCTDLHANRCLCIFSSALTAFLVQVVDSMRTRQIKTFDFGHSACDSCVVVDGIII